MPVPQLWAWFKQEGQIRPEGGLSRDEDNRRYFTDSPVVTHEGKELRFYTDILKDRVVLINFFYVDCPTSPPDIAKLSEVQKRLRTLEEEIMMISITVYPEKDTPKAVRDYVQQFNPARGRLFLTGKKENIDAINRKLGNTSPNPEMHLQVFLLGNLRTGRWMRMNRLAPTASVTEGLRILAEEN
jgi:protein SCO1/2